MLTGLQKYVGGAVRRRASSPRLQVLNTALTTAMSERTLTEARKLLVGGDGIPIETFLSMPVRKWAEG